MRRELLNRRRRVGFASLLVALLALGCGEAAAPSATAAGLRLHDAKIVAPPGGSAAVYLRIQNEGAEPDRLLGLSVQGASASLHRTRIHEGRASMHAVPEGFPIEAGGELELRSGGAHGMLEGLAETPPVGSRLAVTLRFERAGERVVEAPVVAHAGAAGGSVGHEGHAGH